jgi:hypothetical protein
MQQNVGQAQSVKIFPSVVSRVQPLGIDAKAQLEYVIPSAVKSTYAVLNRAKNDPTVDVLKNLRRISVFFFVRSTDEKDFR